MADHTITIQSKGLGDPIRTSQNEGKSGEKIIAEEIKKLLTQMRTDRPETTYAEAQKRYWEETQATRHARNMGNPTMEGSPDDDYQLAGEYKLAGEAQSEPRPQSDQDIAALGFLKEAQEAAAAEAEAAGLMTEAAKLLLKLQENGIESLTEEEATTLAKARESGELPEGYLGGGNRVLRASGSDWGGGNGATPPIVEDPDTSSLEEEEKHDDREDAIEDAIATSAAASSGDDDTNVDDDFAVDDILEDVSEAVGTAASSVPFVGTLASGITKGIASAISLANRTLSSAANVAGGVANTGLGVAGAAAGVMGTTNNPTQGLQAVGSGVTSLTSAMASATKGLGFVNTAFENLNLVVGNAIGVFSSFVSAMEKASEEVMGFNPNILSERINTELMVLQKQIQRSQMVGDELADFEAARGDFIGILEDIKTVLIKVLGPVVTKILKYVTQLLEEFMNSLPAIFQFLSDMVSRFHDILNTTLGHLIGNPIFDALSTMAVTLHTLSEDAKAALEELRKDQGEALDVGFGDWLLGSGSNPFQGVAGVNPGIAHIK